MSFLGLFLGKTLIHNVIFFSPCGIVFGFVVCLYFLNKINDNNCYRQQVDISDGSQTGVAALPSRINNYHPPPDHYITSSGRVFFFFKKGF